MTRAPRWTLAGVLVVVVLTWVDGLWVRLDYDEGVYSQTLRLLSVHQPLVSDVFSSQPPLWPYLALPGWLAGGVTGDRAWIMLWGLLGLYAVWRIARVYTAPTLAGLTTLLVAAAPAYSSTSAAIQADVPALTLALLALSVSLRPADLPYPRTRQVVVGVLFGLALMVKLLVVPMIVVLAVAAYRQPDRRGWRELAVFLGSATAVVVGFGAAFWHHGRLWSEVVGLHVESRSLVEGVRSNLSTALHAPGTCVFLLAAVAAAVEVARRHDPQRQLLLIWFASCGLFLLVHAPLFTHHLVLAVPPAALVIVLAVGDVLSGRRLLAVLAGLVAVSTLGSAIDHFDEPVRDTVRNNAAAAALHRLPADAVIVTDDQVLATAADRSVAGALVDTSQVRISAGDLTPAAICAAIGKADAVLLTRDGRFSALPAVGRCTRSMMTLTWHDAQASLFVRPGVVLAAA